MGDFGFQDSFPLPVAASPLCSLEHQIYCYSHPNALMSPGDNRIICCHQDGHSVGEQTPFRGLWSAERGSESSVLNWANTVDHLKCRVQFLLLVWWTPPLLTEILRKLIFQERAERMEERSVSRRSPGLGGCLREDPTALLQDCPVSFLQSPPCYLSFSLKWQVGVWPLCEVRVSVQWGGSDLGRVRWQEFWGLLWHLCSLREVPRAPRWISTVTSTLRAEDLLLPAQLPSHFAQLTCLFSQLLQFLFTS